MASRWPGSSALANFLRAPSFVYMILGQARPPGREDSIESSLRPGSRNSNLRLIIPDRTAPLGHSLVPLSVIQVAIQSTRRASRILRLWRSPSLFSTPSSPHRSPSLPPHRPLSVHFFHSFKKCFPLEGCHSFV